MLDLFTALQGVKIVGGGDGGNESILFHANQRQDFVFVYNEGR